MRYVLLTLTLLCCANVGAADRPDRPPNILLILVDDLKPALGAYGDAAAITPNMDALAARGVLFERAYANTAVCAPSRYELMLGARSTTTGLYGLDTSLRDAYPDAQTLPQALREQGYRAEAIGKVFHTGHGNTGDARSWSAPPIKDLVIEYVDPASTNGKLTREEAYFGNVEPYLGWRNLTLPRGPAWEAPEVADDAYADGRVAKLAAGRLAELARGDEPFLLAVGFARPHLPFSVPKRYWDLHDPGALPTAATDRMPEDAPRVAGKSNYELKQYAPVPRFGKPDAELSRTLVHGYYAATSYVDAQIGVVLDALDEAGLREDTIVVLWGDHGFHLGDHGLWTKHTTYEQALRLPLLIAGPGVARGVASAPTETVDLYPTLTAMTASDPSAPQGLDGFDLRAVLADPAAPTDGLAHSAFKRPKHTGLSVRDERYRLVLWKPDGRGRERIELYDYDEDPLELRNIADQAPEVVARLRDELDEAPAPPARGDEGR